MSDNVTCPNCAHETALEKSDEGDWFACECGISIYALSASDKALWQVSCYHCEKVYQLSEDYVNATIDCECGLQFIVADKMTAGEVGGASTDPLVSHCPSCAKETPIEASGSGTWYACDCETSVYAMCEADKAHWQVSCFNCDNPYQLSEEYLGVPIDCACGCQFIITDPQVAVSSSQPNHIVEEAIVASPVVEEEPIKEPVVKKTAVRKKAKKQGRPRQQRARGIPVAKKKGSVFNVLNILILLLLVGGGGYLFIQPGSSTSKKSADSANRSNNSPGQGSNIAHATRSKSVHLDPDMLNNFLSNHCTNCHGPQKQKGDTRLDTLSLEIANSDTAQHWQEVLDVLNLGEMPPEEEEQPSNDELEAIIKQLTIALDTSRKRLSEDGGNIALRRINRREYRHTIDQLLGMRILEAILPPDAIGEGYDTVGQDQQFSSHHFEDYLEIAKSVATVALKWVDKEKPDSITYTSSASTQNRRLYSKVKKYTAELAADKAGGKKAGRRTPGLLAPLTRYFKQPYADKGVYLFEASPYPEIWGHRLTVDPRATYNWKVNAGLTGETPGIRHFLKLILDGKSIGYLKVSGSLESPNTQTLLSYRPEFSTTRPRLTVRENKAGSQIYEYLKRIGDNTNKAAIWVKNIASEGPFYGEPSAIETIYKQTIATVDASKGDPELDLQAKQFLKGFMSIAFRGKDVAPEYEELVFKIYSLDRGQGKDVKESLITPLAMILSSPSFLYLMEDAPATNEGFVNEVEFANRISHFLWSHSASGELLADAKAGKLKDKTVLKKHIDRMLKHENSLALSEGFFDQWVDMKRFETIGIDENTHVKFNKGVQYSAKLEVQHFFHTLVKENLSLTNLIDSDFVVINDLLAVHYGLETPNEEGGFRKVKLPADSPRGGLLGTVAFLSMGSNGERSSPIIRGALIQEKFFNRKPPIPPPNVPELDDASDKPLSVKESIALHRKKAQCASCHRSFDPLGYGLENFDLLGLWRNQETIENIGEKNQDEKPTLIPISAEGVFPDQKPFTNLDEFRTGLIANKHLLTRSISKALLSYGLGRHIEFTDKQAVDEICKEASQNNERIGDIIYLIISHPLFRKADQPIVTATL